MSCWKVYILELSDESLYTGITNDLGKRMKAHEAGKGSKYVHGRLPFKVVYLERVADRSEASKREIQIKRLKRKQKLALIEKKNKERSERWKQIKKKTP